MANDKQLEEMMGQLISMVGSLRSSMEEGFAKTGERFDAVDKRLDRIEVQLADVIEEVSYLTHKTAEHDKDIYVLKKRAADQLFGDSSKA